MSKPRNRRPTPAPVSPPAPTGAPRLYDPDQGKAALAVLAPTLDAIPEATFVTLRVDVEAATYAALGVAAFVAAPDVHARFASLPEAEFDVADVDGLEAACFATLYALGEARAAGALETEAKLPPKLAEEAAALEGRMQALCEYHFPEDPEVRPELDRLRPGTGHRDVANDLLGYARIYELRPEVVKTDTKHYRPGDLSRAREVAGAIIQALSLAMTPKARDAFDRYVRAWTHLVKRYGEVRFAGLWLYRRDAKKEQRFPSLFTAGRPNMGKRKGAEPGAEGGEPVAE